MYFEDGDYPEVTRASTAVCAICLKPSAYVCPRCSINYCSLTCYRDCKHSRCSEAFYRDCCMTSLRSTYTSSSGKKNMLEILRRQALSETSPGNDKPIETDGSDFRSEPSSCAEDIDELLERFSDIELTSEDGIDQLDAETIWSRLTVKQRRNFHRWVSSGAAVNSLRLWEPWWRQKVEEMNANCAPTKCCNEPASGKFTDGVKTLSQLLPSGKSPHASVVFALCDLLLGYAFVCRRYNGDHQTLAVDSFSTLCQIDASLSGAAVVSRTGQPVDGHSNRGPSDGHSRTVILSKYPSTHHPTPAPVYTTLSQVLASVQQKLSDTHLPCSPQMMCLLLEDVDAMLQGQAAVNIRRALSDSQQLVDKACKEVEAEPVASQYQLKAARRKLIFLQACMHPVDNAAVQWQHASLPRLGRLVAVELCNQLVHNTTGGDSSLPLSAPTVGAGSSWWQMIRDKRPAETNDATVTKSALVVPMDHV